MDIDSQTNNTNEVPQPKEPEKDLLRASLSLLKRRAPVIVFIVIILAGICFNLFLLYLYYTPAPKALWGDEKMYSRNATAIAQGKEVEVNPHWPRGYIDALGMLFSFTGAKPIYMQISNIVMLFASAILWYLITFRLSRSRVAASVVLAFFLLTPDLVAFSHYFWPEIPHIFLFTLAIWVLLLGPEKIANVAISGFLLGLALHTKLLLKPFILVVIFFSIMLNKRDWKKRVLNASFLVIFLLIAIVPAMINNYKDNGIFGLADSSYTNIWIALNFPFLINYEGITPHYNSKSWDEYLMAKKSWERKLFKVDDDPEKMQLLRRQRKKYLNFYNEFWAPFRAKILDKSRYKEFKEETYNITVAYVKERGIFSILYRQMKKQYFLLLNHDNFFTQQMPGGPRQSYKTKNAAITKFLLVYSDISYALLLALAVAGACWLRPLKFTWSNFFFLFILYNLAAFIIIMPHSRYRIQLLPFLIFFAGIASALIFDRETIKNTLGDSFCVSFSKTRIILTVLFVLLFEFFAFRSFLFWQFN